MHINHFSLLAAGCDWGLRRRVVDQDLHVGQICAKRVFLRPLVKSVSEVQNDGCTTGPPMVHMRLDDVAQEIVDGWSVDVVGVNDVRECNPGILGKDWLLGDVENRVFELFRWGLIMVLHKQLSQSGGHQGGVHLHQISHGGF